MKVKVGKGYLHPMQGFYTIREENVAIYSREKN